jgi:hypothetical protein
VQMGLLGESQHMRESLHQGMIDMRVSFDAEHPRECMVMYVLNREPNAPPHLLP